MADLSPKCFTHAEIVQMSSMIDQALEGTARDRINALEVMRSYVTSPEYNGSTNLTSNEG